MTTHLTHQQLCDLLIAGPYEISPELQPLRDHLRSCTECSKELDSLRQPLQNFRAATTAWASHNSANRSLTLPLRSHSFGAAGWMLAAAALLLALLVPVALHERHSSASAARNTAVAPSNSSVHSSSTIGDEALLEAIDQTVSSSVPTPMEPLADPTAGRSTQTDSTPRKN
jgi:hypothetical protein